MKVLRVMHGGLFEGSFLHVMPRGPFLRVMHGTDGRQFFLFTLKYIYLEISRRGQIMLYKYMLNNAFAH